MKSALSNVVSSAITSMSKDYIRKSGLRSSAFDIFNHKVREETCSTIFYLHIFVSCCLRHIKLRRAERIRTRKAQINKPSRQLFLMQSLNLSTARIGELERIGLEDISLLCNLSSACAVCCISIE